MTHVAFIHSYRGGTGKSTLAANLATLLAAMGKKVGIVDTNLQAPSLHYLFGVAEPTPTLNDYLRGKCEIRAVAQPVLPKQPPQRAATRASTKTKAVDKVNTAIPGSVYLIPASDRINQIVYTWAKGFDMEFLLQGLEEVNQQLALDFLLVDTDPGMDRQTFFALELADSFVMVFTAAEQDYRGAAATVRIARLLEIPNIYTLLNKIPAELDTTALRLEFETLCESALTAQLPHAPELLALADRGLFVLRHPEHPITQELRRVADELTMGTKGAVQINQQTLSKLLA